MHKQTHSLAHYFYVMFLDVVMFDLGRPKGVKGIGMGTRGTDRDGDKGIGIGTRGGTDRDGDKGDR